MTSLGALFELYGLIFDRGYNTPCASRDNTQGKLQQLKPVLEYIELNYQSPITLEDLSRLAGMSSKYFCRFFRAVIHRTPIDYLNYYRIERACYLMAAEGILSRKQPINADSMTAAILSGLSENTET